MSNRLLHIVSFLLCVACVFNMSAQEAMDSVTIDSILSAQYPRIHPVYLDSTQIAEQASSINVPVVSSAEYSETPTSASLNFNKSVGQIPIKSDITSTGAKTYEIPIDVYPGMNGMTPSISLFYNSHGGNGIIGVGWSLSGVLAISRGTKNILNDGYVSGIGMNTGDVFMLEGTRLIKLSEISGYNIYESEQGNIKVKGYKSDGAITYFEVFYPDGKKGVYGYSSNTENRLTYPLVSLSDIKGNIVNYTYTFSNNNYTLTEISYNGVSITFDYSTDRPDPIYSFRGGLNVSDTHLLKSISCKLGDNLLNTYAITYVVQNNLSLVSQIDYSAGGESYNPIHFYYNTRTSGILFDTSQTILSGYYPFSGRNGIRYTRGKFNYDAGDDGLAVYPNYPTYIKIRGVTGGYNNIEYTYFNNYYEGDEKIFIYSGIGKNITQAGQEITTEAGFVDLLSADLDGNQQEYLIKVNNRVVNGQEQLTFRAYKVGIFPTPLEVYNKSFTLSTTYNGGNGKLSVQPKFYHVGDFNGDGKQEIMAVSANEPFGDTSLPSKVYVFDIVNGNILHEKHVFDYNVEFLWVGSDSIDAVTAEHNTDKLFVLDYDGDGKTDVCHINSGWMMMYYFDTSGSTLTLKQKVGSTVISKNVLSNRELLFGEFNGDGFIDMLLSPPSGSATDKNWTILNSKGDGLFQSYRFTAINYEDDDECGYITQDVNNDGISDILKYEKNGFYVYLVKNNQFGTQNGYYGFPKELSVILPTSVNTHNIFTQVVAFRDSRAKCYSANHDYNKESLITGMANSMGMVERNTYRKIDTASTESGFYTKGSGAVFPYVNIQEPLYVLASTETFVNGSTVERIDYNYQNAVIHRQGLGFCGFGEIRCTDSRAKTRTQIFDPYKYGVMTKEITDEYENIYNYSAFRRTNGTLRLHLGSKTEKDLLKGTQTVTLIDYDDYESPKYIAVYYPNGITTNTNNYYSNNPDIGDGYYIGFLYEQSVITHRTGTESITERMFIPAHSSMLPSVKQCFINGNLIENNVYQYDEQGNLTSHKVTPYESSVAQVTNYNYDSYGRLVKKTDPMGLTNEYAFDNKGRVSSFRDKRNNVTTYAYDSFGRDTLTVYPDGTKQTVKYAWSTDRSRELYSITTSETGQPAETVYYDALNREMRRGTVRFDGSVIYVDKVYNSVSNLSKESLPYKTGSASLWNVYTYDKHDRVTAYTQASGNTTTYSYNGTKVTTVEDGVSITRNYDALGNLITVEDAAGIVSYNLCADGKPSSITAPGNVTTTFEYDKYRRRISLNDPSHGTTTYEYSAAGNVFKEIDARGHISTYSYDNHNRLVYAEIPEMVVSYIYNEYNELTETITEYMSGTSLQTYSCTDYDDYGRIASYSEMLDNKTFKKDFEYSSGNVSCVKYYYNSSLLAKENYEYSNGYLERIKIDDFTRYKLSAENEFGQPTQISSYRNTRYYNYDSYGIPIGRKVKNAHGDTIQNETYFFDPVTRNLLSRGDKIHNKVETFTYDNLNRLVGDNSGNIQYDVKGNILFKSGVGSMGYNHPTKPYAITDVESEGESIPGYTQSISYTSFHRPNVISENGIEARLQYDGNGDRHRMYVKRNGNTILTRYYFSDCYERDIDSLSNVTQRLYLGGSAYDATMMLEIDSAGSELHYLFRDYLGNVRLVTDRFGDVVQELSYDAWGRLRDPATHEIYNIGEEPELIIGRGYTSHEHLPWFGLINMNARLYDPVLGRFLSPDPFVQAPDLSQSFNRYAYAMNNPFRYTDKSGEFFIIDDWILGGIKGLFNGDGFLKSANKHAWNSIKIWGGLFTTDPNKSFWGRTWEVLSRFTYQGFQTMLGLGYAHILNKYTDSVKSVDYLFGATVIKSSSLGNSGITLGSYITGGNNIEADPNNSLFQHEYGHYLQSQEMGWAYISKVGIPSLRSAIKYDNDEHGYQRFEQDANLRAFKYFNKNVEGFYTSRDEWTRSGHRKGWNFFENPLVSKFNNNNHYNYIDYRDKDIMAQLENSLSIKAMFYHYIPVIPGFFEKLKGNY